MDQRPRAAARRGLCAMAVTVLLSAVVAASGTVSAAQFDVTNTNDAGPGSLRQAIADADANDGPDTIVVQPGLGTIVLTSPLEWGSVDAGSLTIQGNGVIVDFGGSPLGFVDDSGFDLTIDGMTITGVRGSSSADAAPVVVQGGAVTLSNCTITGNDVSTDDGDVAGGVLSQGGSVTVDGCTITANNAASTAGDGGGGILSEGGSVVVANSTISGNTVNAQNDAGGGIAAAGGDVTVRSSTINCNRAQGQNAGGGILSAGGEIFNVVGSSIQGNVAFAVEGESDDQILSLSVEPFIEDSTVSDDTSVCEEPPTPPSPPSSAPSGSTPAAGGGQAATQPRFTG